MSRTRPVNPVELVVWIVLRTASVIHARADLPYYKTVDANNAWTDVLNVRPMPWTSAREAVWLELSGTVRVNV